MNQTVINSLIELINGYNRINNSSNTNKDKYLDSIKYLIGQTIRQYDVDPNKCHVSAAAQKLWGSLTTGTITNYSYQQNIKCNAIPPGSSVKCNTYKGASKTPFQKNKTFKTNDQFKFVEIFLVEHMVPVCFIRDELLKLKNPNATSVQGVLDNIHLAWITKDENKNLGQTKGRTLNYIQVYNNVYVPAGVSPLHPWP